MFSNRREFYVAWLRRSLQHGFQTFERGDLLYGTLALGIQLYSWYVGMRPRDEQAWLVAAVELVLCFIALRVVFGAFKIPYDFYSDLYKSYLSLATKRPIVRAQHVARSFQLTVDGDQAPPRKCICVALDLESPIELSGVSAFVEWSTSGRSCKDLALWYDDATGLHKGPKTLRKGGRDWLCLAVLTGSNAVMAIESTYRGARVLLSGGSVLRLSDFDHHAELTLNLGAHGFEQAYRLLLGSDGEANLTELPRL